MDVEKMKRINALARELKDHGIVSDYNDAYIQAEKMIEGGLLGRKEIEDAEAQLIMPKAEARAAASPLIGLNALEIKNVNERINNVEQQISQVFVKINEIITEINRIDRKKKESPIEMKEEKPSEVQAHLKDEKVQPHPRTGDYKPEDVSIEKMFYFGRG